MIIDFKEIESSDDFELFAREFFEQLGYTIIQEPSRGADGGLDIKILKEEKYGDIYWLVSCKHYAKSNNSVGVGNEVDISDRILSNKCDGFIGFYSTIPSTGLINKLDKLPQFQNKIFDKEKIEREIVGVFNMEKIFTRFFPISYQKWKDTYYYLEPINLIQYYLKTEYKEYFDIFSLIFKDSNQIVKLIQNHDSLPSLFETLKFNVKFVDFNREKFETVPGYIYLIIEEVNEIDFFNIKFLKSLSFGFDEKINDSYYLAFYNDFIIIHNVKYLEILNEIFLDLKKMLR